MVKHRAFTIVTYLASFVIRNSPSESLSMLCELQVWGPPLCGVIYSPRWKMLSSAFPPNARLLLSVTVSKEKTFSLEICIIIIQFSNTLKSYCLGYLSVCVKIIEVVCFGRHQVKYCSVRKFLAILRYLMSCVILVT